MDDKLQSKPNWTEIGEALRKKDIEKISLYKQQCTYAAEHNARKYYLKRFSIQSTIAITLVEVTKAIKSNKNDLVTQFKQQIVNDYILRHGLTVYTDVEQIQPGDSIVITWTYKEKNKTKESECVLRIISPVKNGWLASPAQWENDSVQFDCHKQIIQISNVNFVVGVRQAIPPIMKKPQKFYFINFLE